ELIDMKIRRGTRNYLHEAAMSREEMELAIDRGAEIATMCHNDGCNIISYGEMGITNTSSSSLWMSLLTGVDLKLCVGAGSDASNGITAHKYSVLKHAKESYKGDGSAEDVMAYFGGYEMVMAVGAMLRAAELGMVVLIDGFIMSACALMSTKLYPASKEYFIFAHQGDESGHKLLLEAMDAHGILSLNLRLGEGTGALCAYPIVESAVRMICEMSSFERVNVTKYF
ncbi:MAG: nicotinate-nucleotide--dimethylbenzimidazole phosphoribosyltransferase, partial [Rikenellaceae bacterium]